MYKRILSLGILTLIASVTLTFGAPNQPAAAAETGGSISGTVYFDTDMDGERDAGEEPAPGRKIELLQYLNESPWELTLDTDVSDRHGAYTLNGVLPGAQYVVSLHLDADTPCWNRESFDFPFDNGTIDTDFGVLEKGTGSISGSLFNDRDEDGALDLDEPGYEGWSVQLDADAEFGHNVLQLFRSDRLLRPLWLHRPAAAALSRELLAGEFSALRDHVSHRTHRFRSGTPFSIGRSSQTKSTSRRSTSSPTFSTVRPLSTASPFAIST